MKNQSQGSVIGFPIRSVTGKPSINEPIVAYSPIQYGTSHLKQKRLESIIDLMNKFRRKADNLAQGIRDHVSLGPGVSETVKGKLKLGTRILQAGGIERVFRKSFAVVEGEKLVKAFQCHLSTTAGPIPGLLFISTEKIAFLSDRSLVFRSPKGNVARIPYKVLIPLRRIKGVNPSENSNKPNHKYIQIETTDDFEFWFMGFVCYQRSFKILKLATSESQMGILKLKG
ncbi:GEM-like protein 7 isoform X1 [Dendrobium catenatum]|uniref:GEM-like protein 7 isoform X1 n=1 Tax=Dendrobium catenatum TaxID=906689 RepID=UPI0009F500A7|nr:GEM-like protein 7 isoform X1 [Dendrobium catenatum]XP_020677879.1 GEM-like protein 7 isoform X1 [Dendrobium catenatum]XP_028552914.1 GEM-like protein 7 isoform X1 [Dendrobium catenatum]